jgi:hypothetical protein
MVFEEHSGDSSSGPCSHRSNGPRTAGWSLSDQQDDSAATDAANNPTTPKLIVEAQDYWMRVLFPGSAVIESYTDLNRFLSILSDLISESRVDLEYQLDCRA